MRWRRVDPACAARVILDARYAQGTADNDVISLSPAQRAGVTTAAAILSEWGGVLLCDDVGLGKTHQAIALAAAEVKAGGAAAAIVPASLLSHWRQATRAVRPALPLVSHSRLALRGPSVLPASSTLLVVDEAHQFRNPHTRRYRALAAAATLRRIVLVTATPINNSARDLYALLRLFLGDRELERVGIPDLRAALLGPSVDHSALARTVDLLVVRRTDRTSLGPGLEFPARAPPRAIHVEHEAHADLIGAACEFVMSAPLAPWRLADYGVAAVPDSRALVRASMLKRLDSSTAAFRSSLHRHDGWLRRFAEALAAGRLLRVSASVHTDGDQLGFVLLEGEAVADDVDVAGLSSAANAERAAIQRLLQAMPGGSTADGKLAALLALLRTELRNDVVVIFTEYRETAAHLFRALSMEFRAALIHGTGARIASGPIPRAHALRLFAPIAQHAPQPPEHQRLQILIATDVLAEGLNLQDARVVISYDLPWNPVRLMQRIGRIDRLGSPHAEIAAYSFAPHPRVEHALRLLATVERKIELIEDALPGGRVVLPADTGGVRSNIASVLSETSRVADALRALHARIATDAHVRDEPRGIPVVATLRVDDATAPAAIVAWRSGSACWLECADAAGRRRPLDMAAVELLRAALLRSERSRPRTADVALMRSIVRELRRTAASEPARPDAAAIAAGRRLMELLGRDRYPDSRLCGQVDRLLASLGRSLPFGVALALRSAVRASNAEPSETAQSACRRFEAVLPARGLTPTRRPEPLALLVFVPHGSQLTHPPAAVSFRGSTFPRSSVGRAGDC